MLLNSFFFIDHLEHSNEVVQALLRLESSHPIFKGHFPNIPVVPGVCMMQMVKEVMENLEGKQLLVADAPNIKFLSVLDPNEKRLIDASISIDERVGDNQLKVSATISKDAVIFFKMKATLRIL